MILSILVITFTSDKSISHCSLLQRVSVLMDTKFWVKDTVLSKSYYHWNIWISGSAILYVTIFYFYSYQAVAKMVQQCCSYADEITDLPIKLRLIDTLRMVTEGKVKYCFLSGLQNALLYIYLVNLYFTFLSRMCFRLVQYIYATFTFTSQ